MEKPFIARLYERPEIIISLSGLQFADFPRGPTGHVFNNQYTGSGVVIPSILLEKIKDLLAMAWAKFGFQYTVFFSFLFG